jgi:16S rRNA processing protein RimM
MSNVPKPAEAPADLIELGRIAAAYGVKGWVKIQPHSADADVLRSVTSDSSASSPPVWWLMRPVAPAASGKAPASGAQPFQVKAARAHGAHIVAQLAGIDDRDQADALRGMSVCMPRQAFPAPDEDEYYWVDLIGCTVWGQDNGEPALLGVVDEVLDNGAHALLRVLRQRHVAGQPTPEPMLDAKGRPLEVLVPFVQAHVQAVDLAQRRIDSDWPLDF